MYEVEPPNKNKSVKMNQTLHRMKSVPLEWKREKRLESTNSLEINVKDFSTLYERKERLGERV